MKRIITILMLVLMMASVVCASDGEFTTDEGYEVSLPYVLDQLSWWENLKYNFGTQAFTVVGGATCSLEPDYETTFTETNTEECYTNTAHIGVAFQLFEADPWKYLGEKQILKGGTQCFGTVVGKQYYKSYYYCDSTSAKTCTDPDGDDTTVKTTLTFTQDGTTYSYTDRCISSTELQERRCDADDSVQSFITNCQCVDGACVGTVEADPEITFGTISVQQPVVEGDKYRIIGTAYVRNECDNCIIETGIVEYGQALTVSESSSSGACGDDDTVGIKFDAENEWVQFTLTDEADVAEGNYDIRVYAFSGCWADGGEELARSDKLRVKVLPEVTEPETYDCWYCYSGTPKLTEGLAEPCNEVTHFASVSDLPCQEEEPPIDTSAECGNGFCETGETEACPEDCGIVAPEPTLVECYGCSNNIVWSAKYFDECPDGTYSAEPDCSEVDEIDCTNTPDAPACNPDCEGDDCVVQECDATENPECAEEPSQNFITGWAVWDYYDEEPGIAIGITVMVVIILALAVYLFMPSKKKSVFKK